MSNTAILQAKVEINNSLVLITFCMKCMGLSFEDAKSTTTYFIQKLVLLLSVSAVCYHVFSDIVYIAITLANSPRVEDVVPLFHPFGYGVLSIAKGFALWYKKDDFKQLIDELAVIWPDTKSDQEAQTIKDNTLATLLITHQWYFAINIVGMLFYGLTPIVIYIYEQLLGQEPEMGFVWICWYPFDKRKPIAHVFVYLFEVFIGQTCVWVMVSTDLLFSGMASHIGMLLRMLQRRLENIASTEQTDDEIYKDIVANIKLHQRLIRYCNDLSESFSLSFLVNIVLSSINICCVVFVIVLLDPVMAVSNKLYISSVLMQIGILCWYADLIIHANADVAVAAYNSCWYRTNPRCRRALLFLIQRAQKPIAFTAMGFTNVSLATYSSILTTSYSYFALAYTMYNKNLK
ncbi:odorant receptor 4 [Galleria mellonella]|uniref:Odorant receptor n=1 Tax=Galleria mellonella TaxID=7137 RepID=A0A5C0E4B1_GALME|nr:odorant receptor 4 [Galleria mellonella]QEI46818.1 odorant receptor 2 [Galleria mellonella]